MTCASSCPRFSSATERRAASVFSSSESTGLSEIVEHDKLPIRSNWVSSDRMLMETASCVARMSATRCASNVPAIKKAVTNMAAVITKVSTYLCHCMGLTLPPSALARKRGAPRRADEPQRRKQTKESKVRKEGFGSETRLSYGAAYPDGDQRKKKHCRNDKRHRPDVEEEPIQLRRMGERQR